MRTFKWWDSLHKIKPEHVCRWRELRAAGQRQRVLPTFWVKSDGGVMGGLLATAGSELIAWPGRGVWPSLRAVESVHDELAGAAGPDNALLAHSW